MTLGDHLQVVLAPSRNRDCTAAGNRDPGTKSTFLARTAKQLLIHDSLIMLLPYALFSDPPRKNEAVPLVERERHRSR
jgi:hypothetical protein